jgi:hypothetical protein
MSARRLVLYGPPLAGKTTMMDAYGRTHSLAIRRFETSAEGEMLHDRGLRIDLGADGEIVSIVGSFFNSTSWPNLVALATALIVVIDSQATREQTSRDFVASLGSMPRVPTLGCVVWTKGDLIAQGVSKRVTSDVLRGTKCEGWTSFGARYDEPSTLVNPIEWLMAKTPVR